MFNTNSLNKLNYLKIFIVKPPDFQYFYLNRTKVGAGANRFCPEKSVNKQIINQTTSEEPDEV
jgi:hypothetical protein